MPSASVQVSPKCYMVVVKGSSSLSALTVAFEASGDWSPLLWCRSTLRGRAWQEGGPLQMEQGGE
ncbi:hypothetical protein GCM10010129_76890 [Streptomyces fumigatiscleroticus]|nr:hypothetical protein GCM10010129_76890 [Streptomyces fumigatiscleroticus]